MPIEEGYPLTARFRSAITDYRYLLERGYSHSSALRVVGDRYQLDSEQRSMLYRGISPRETARLRRTRLVASVVGAAVAVDCYNVLYTVTNYLYGRPLFICDDGFLRDSGELHQEKPADLDRSVALLFRWTRSEPPAALSLYLDSPVSRSGELALELRRRLEEARIAGTAEAVRSPDHLLKECRTGLIATSDSSVIDRAQVGVADLARKIIESSFEARFISLDATDER